MKSEIWRVRSFEMIEHGRLVSGFRAVRDELERLPTASLSLPVSGGVEVQVKRQAYVVASLAQAKLLSLCSLLARSVEEQDWFAFGLGGRALVEHAATLRYYLWEKVSPVVAKNERDQPLSEEQYDEVQRILRQCIHGGRFDWSGILEAWLDTRLLPKPPHTEPPSQVNILTCIQKWGREHERIELVYGMFCDLVHPNLGSSLLVMDVSPAEIAFRCDGENSLGGTIASGTGRILLGIAEDFAKVITRLRAAALDEAGNVPGEA